MRTAKTELLPQQIEDRKAYRLYIIMAVIMVAVILISMSIGRFSIPIIEEIRILISRIIPLEQTWTDMMENILLTVRLPRLIGAILVGISLSVSGATYQSMFRNPLVSPDILGVSQGACVGAAIGILLHVGSFGIEVTALAGGIIAVILTVFIPKLFRNQGNLMLVLAGVLISGLMGSLLSFLKYIADADTELQEITYWIMGSLASVRWRDLAFVAPGMIICIVVLFILRWKMNVLSLGNKEATSLGVNVKFMRAVFIVCATYLTSSSVCISGTIGWIGLVIPHMCRIVVGQDNKHLIPASIFLGAAFLVVVDTICRTISSSEIPLSIFTGLIGVPLFIWLLFMQKTKVGL